MVTLGKGGVKKLGKTGDITYEHLLKKKFGWMWYVDKLQVLNVTWLYEIKSYAQDGMGETEYSRVRTML